MNQLILSIDLGTTGCRTVIFNELGDPLNQSYQEYKSIYLSSRWIDHDPKTWLEATQSTVKGAISKLNGTHKNFSAISVTSQRATVIPVDKDGNVIDNAILWQDKRAIEETEQTNMIKAKAPHRPPGIDRIKFSTTSPPPALRNILTKAVEQPAIRSTIPVNLMVLRETSLNTFQLNRP